MIGEVRDDALTLCTAPGLDMLHTSECPHLTSTSLAGLVPATPEQLETLEVCGSCRSVLDGDRRHTFETLDAALEAFNSPLENRTRIREIAAGLSYSRVWIPASASYIGIAGAPGTPAIAYFGKGYADLHPGHGCTREWLPVNAGRGGDRQMSGGGDRVQPVCETCFTVLPATGRCDQCD